MFLIQLCRCTKLSCLFWHVNQDFDSNLYVAYSVLRPQVECTTTRNPHKGVHALLLPRLGQLFTPIGDEPSALREGYLQRPP
jgi:hypothetical protein